MKEFVIAFLVALVLASGIYEAGPAQVVPGLIGGAGVVNAAVTSGTTIKEKLIGNFALDDKTKPLTYRAHIGEGFT